MAREPREAPELPGHEFVKHLGSGGFADVFLYRESVLGDRAVKVLDPRALPPGHSLDHFQIEAQLMASVSRHPNIVQIFAFGTAPDGRPYLAMEYYSGGNFEQRSRPKGMSVSESLSVGVQVASAVETAHQANIIHHDIKPANILLSGFGGVPGLTDFGIAVVQEQAASSSGALSIPWSSPEALRDQPTDKRSDVYSLAASVYTMLAGRAPYEEPGGDNGSAALMRRGKAGKLRPTGRSDVPRSLEDTLRRAMSTVPADRQGSAAEFGRDLRAVESELGFSGTPLVLEGTATRSDNLVRDDGRPTDARPVTIAPHADPVAPARPRRPIVVAELEGYDLAERQTRPRRGLREPEPLGDTIARDSRPGDDARPALEPGNKRPTTLIATAVAAVVVAIVLSVILSGSPDEPAVDDSGDVDITEINDGLDTAPIQIRPAPVLDLVVRSTGSDNVFSWSPSAEADRYNVIPDGGPPSMQPGVSFETAAECIEVQAVSPRGDFSDPVRKCV